MSQGTSGIAGERARWENGTSHSGNSVKVALVQLLVEGGEPARNLTRAVEMLRVAAGPTSRRGIPFLPRYRG